MEEIILHSIIFPGIEGVKYIIPKGGFKITITDNGGSISADKSYAAITAALESGFVYAMANGQYFAYDKSVSETRYVFKTVSVNEDGVEETAYYIDSNDAVSKSTIRYGGRIFKGEIVTTGGAQYLQLEDSGSEIINALADGDVTIRVKSTLTVDDESENLYIPFRPALYGDDSIGTATFIGDFVFLLEARRYQVTISTDDAAGDNIAITDITPSGGIPDAPSDGKQYARKDGAWSEVESGGYEPPVGGIPYADLSSDVQESLDKADSALQEDDLEEAEQIEIDTVVTENSSNLITSGAVFDVLGDIEAAINAIRGES